MEFDSPDVEKDFPGLYASETVAGKKKEESDFSEGDHDKVSKKDLLIGRRKDKKDKKDRGYAALEGESSPEDDLDANPSKSSKKSKAFKFSSSKSKEKREKSRDKEKLDKEVKDKDDKEKDKDSKDGKEKKRDKDKKEKDKKEKSKDKEKKDKKSKTSVSEEVLELGDVQPVFGVSVSLATERSRCHDGIDLPLVVRDCIDYLQENGLKSDQIYKVEPVKTRLQHYKRLYNNRESQGTDDMDVPTACGLLKLFLKELPEPILTTDLIARFEEVSSHPQVTQQEKELKSLLLQLPNCNKTLLSWILLHFDSVIQNEKQNKMNAQSLAMLLSPPLQMSHRLLVTLLCHCPNLFAEVELKKWQPCLRCEFVSKDGTIAAVGERREQLFEMCIKVQIETDKMANVATNQTLSLKLWHERMAHQNVAHIRSQLKKEGIAFEDDVNFSCDSCIFGKQHRLPFPKSEFVANRPGQLVHVDVCGPMEETSLGGAKYFILFKDHFSHYKMVFFLKHKSEVCNSIEQFIDRARCETSCLIKIIRTDNGSEFVNESVKSLLASHGIRHETTVPYTPEQNGSAERENRTVVEAARTMLHGKNLEKKFWAEAVNTAVYVLNRTGTSSLKGKNPYELWWDKKPRVEDFKVFGIEAFIHVPKQKRKKWDKKAEKGIFMGYADNTKGFRVWLPAARKVGIVRDVTFRERDDDEQHVMLRQNDTHEEPEVAVILPTPDVDSKNGETHQRECNLDFEDEGATGNDDAFKSAGEDDDSNDDGGGGERTLPLKQRLRDLDPVDYSGTCNILYKHAFLVQGEPNSYRHALACDDAAHWKEAMADEMDSLYKNRTWDLVKCPDNRKPIDNKWVYKLKSLGLNGARKYKARLVIRGFSQEEGVDYGETFSPVAKFTSIRTIFAIAANEGLSLTQFDVKTAFLNGELSEEIYMEQPQGFNDGSGRVCRLRKSLYGLKQASRCWNKKFTDVLKEFSLKPSTMDPCVFISGDVNKRLILAIYIDDGLIAAREKQDAMKLVKFLKKQFEITLLDAEMFLGIELVRRSDGGIFISQQRYAESVLKRFNMENSKPVSTPAETCSHQEPMSSGDVKFPYREAVGCLMYLAIATRPDIAYAVGVVSRYLDSPNQVHINAVKRILKYIRGTRTMGITFKKSNNFDLVCFSDADYAGDPVTRRSTTGYIFIISNGPVSWSSQRQKCVSLSTTESEFVAASQAVKEMVWLKQLLLELVTTGVGETSLNMDNQGAIRLVKNPEFHKRTKHIDVRYHFIRERYERGDFKINYVPSEFQKSGHIYKVTN